MLTFRTSNGEIIKVGDYVAFSFGVPPTRVEGTVTVNNGQLYLATPGVKPSGGTLAFIEKHTGTLRKVRPATEGGA